MSKERELLKQVVENFAYVQDMHLIVAIQKLLNQPESLREDLREDLREGISLRDHFACAAMQGVVVSRPTWEDTRRIALTAYEMSDAMLKERSKRDE